MIGYALCVLFNYALVVANHPDNFRRIEALPGLSDHDIVFTEVNINPKKSIQKPLYRRANWENMKDDLNKLHISDLSF
jgi:hypothetical protein